MCKENRQLQPSPHDGEMVYILPPGSAEGADDTVQIPDAYRKPGSPYMRSGAPVHTQLETQGKLISPISPAPSGGRRTFPVYPIIKERYTE